MTRLEYWIRADTQYRVHSPLVFEMYRKVLFAEVDGSLRRRMAEELPAEAEGMVRCAARRDRPYHDMVYKLRDHYGMTVVSYDEDEAVLRGGTDPVSGRRVMETVKVVCRPHRHHARDGASLAVPHARAQDPVPLAAHRGCAEHSLHAVGKVGKE